MVHRLLIYFKRKNRLGTKRKMEEQPDYGDESDNLTAVAMKGRSSKISRAKNTSTEMEEVHVASTNEIDTSQSNCQFLIRNLASKQEQNPARYLPNIEPNTISTSTKRRNLKYTDDPHHYHTPPFSNRRIDATKDNSIEPKLFRSNIAGMKVVVAENQCQLLRDDCILDICQTRNLSSSSIGALERNQDIQSLHERTGSDVLERNPKTIGMRVLSTDRGIGSTDLNSTSNRIKKPLHTLKTNGNDCDSHTWKRYRSSRKKDGEAQSRSHSSVRSIHPVNPQNNKNPKVSLREMREDDYYPSQRITPNAVAIKSLVTGSSVLPNHANFHQREQGGLLSTVLYDTEDEGVLTDYQCELRKHLEIFEASAADVRVSTSPGRCGKIVQGQIGVRCIHCAKSGPLAGGAKGAVNFSRTIEGIYQVAQNIAKAHLCGNCCNIPNEEKHHLDRLRQDSRRAKGGKDYWGRSIRRLGVSSSQGKLVRNVP